MSYYDDYSYDDDDDDYDDDDYSSEDEIFYHNYSVDYANQILGGHHAISSCLPLMHRKSRRHSPRLVRVATLDQMPIVNRHQTFPSLRSRPKYANDEDISPPLPQAPPPPLPSLQATGEELERRATRTTQPTFEQTPNNTFPLSGNNNPSSENTYRPMNEAELRQVQQQQEAFQQHLLNMQRHLLEQTHQQQEQPQQEQQVPTSSPSTSRRFEKRTKVSYHDLERDDDQAQIAELIENDPYFAAAMEDFAHTHGLLHSHRHRTHSNHSSSQHSSRFYKRHRPSYRGEISRLSSSSSSSSSSISSLTNVTSDLKGSKTDLILFRELHGIRRLMEEYVRGRTNLNQPTISIMPVPWPMTGGPFPTPTGVHYPPVPPVTDYQPSMVPRERVPPPEPGRVLYENVVNTVREVMDRRSPSQRDQPLKPSQIDPKLKYVYTKRPRIPPLNFQSTSMQRPPLPPQQQRRRRSSQMSTPTILSPSPLPPPPPSNNIPPAPPYEALANFTSSRSTINKTRNLSYGNRQKQSNIYDTLQPRHYFRAYTNK